jgi:hypothetical protein
VAFTALERRGVFDAAGRYFKPAAHVPAVTVTRDDVAEVAYRRLHHLRPAEISRLSAAYAPLSTAQANLMRKAHSDLTKILHDVRGRPLLRSDVERILPHVNGARVNGVRAKGNCVECSLALDDIIAGKAVVAGPSRGIHAGATSELLDGGRAKSSLHRLLAHNVTPLEKQLLASGPGSRALIYRGTNMSEGVSGHIYNAANVDGKVLYMDAQTNEIFDQHPAKGFSTMYNFFRTA